MGNDGAPTTTTSSETASTSATKATGCSKKGSWWSRFHRCINGAADNFFYRQGYWVASHPKLTLLICGVLVAACFAGFVNFEVESDGEDLWVPSDSLSKQQEKLVLSYFNDGAGGGSTFSPTAVGMETREKPRLA